MFLASKPPRVRSAGVSMQCDPGCSAKCWETCNYDCFTECWGTEKVRPPQ